MRPRFSSPHLIATATLFSLSAVTATTCPYDFVSATSLIPPSCYSNYTAASAATAPPTNCCFFVFAAYLFAAIRHSNSSGNAFLPDSYPSTCSDSFTKYILSHHLARPSLLNTADSCNLNMNLSAGTRPCLYHTVSDIYSAVNLSKAIPLCTSRDLTPEPFCTTCQQSVITATLSLLDLTKSKEFVPCGMATTIGIWSSAHLDIGRFRSYVICMNQVLDNIGNLGTSDLIPSPPPPTSTGIHLSPAGNSGTKKHAAKIAAASAAGGLLSITIILFVLISIIRKRRKQKSIFVSISVGVNSTATIGSPLPTDGLYIFTKSELKQATNGFDSRLLLGEGGSGRVYLGKLPSGQHVAIKRIYKIKKIDEFYREIEILAKLRHRNLTTLLGYCLQKKEHVLVFEYMPGGNLSDTLYHGDLTWQERVKIAVDIAEGLTYLHEFPDGPVVHRDVKPTNILLSDNKHAKLSDFGVSKIVPLEISQVSTEIRGTTGYLDPDCFSSGHVSEATDVYSFGIVLLELVTGRRAIMSTPSGGAESIVHAAHELVVSGLGGEPEVRRIADEKLGQGLDTESVGEVFKVAYRCVRPYKQERPRIKEVLEVLKSVLANIDVRPEVAGLPPSSESVGDEFSSDSTSRVSNTPSVHGWSM
ncbi:proline-rich receptor-like protein kinase PERK3 [Tasmannia lanceolata]|uniref:proline-rich receptor-like protein kinase PERK3 n=1 Tax=Tasmannia lanceolata TaxID=3420 RepID=UPI0040647AA2